MSQPIPGIPEQTASKDVEANQSSRSGRRRRGRRGGRGRKNQSPNSATAVALGMMNPPEPDWAGDEQEVSQQLRMLMSPHGTPSTTPKASTTGRDPQLTYTPPAAIESYQPKAHEAPVSAKSFKKNESPLQAVVAVAGSMAILAALYHFGYWEGSQVQLESPTEFASVAIPPAMSVAPDPLQYQPTISIGPTTTVASPADVAPVPQQSMKSVLVTPPPLEAVPQPEAPTRVETQPSAPKPTPVVKVSTGPSGLYLQVGALKDSVAARGLELRLRTAGFAVEVIDDSSDGLIRVISGPYDEMPQARIAAKEMSSLGVKSFPKRF